MPGSPSWVWDSGHVPDLSLVFPSAQSAVPTLGGCLPLWPLSPEPSWQELKLSLAKDGTRVVFRLCALN